jgi:hypothetical protein
VTPEQVRQVGLGVTRPARLLRSLLLIAAALLAFGWLLQIAQFSFGTESSLLPLFGAAAGMAGVLVALFLLLPAGALHLLARAALKGSRSALLINLVVATGFIGSFFFPIAALALSSAVEYPASTNEQGVNPVARLLLFALLEAIAVIVLALMGRAWWKLLLATYLLVRIGGEVSNEP